MQQPLECSTSHTKVCHSHSNRCISLQSHTKYICKFKNKQPLESYWEIKHLNHYARIKVNDCHPLAAVLQHEGLPNVLTKSFLERVTEIMNKYNIAITLSEKKVLSRTLKGSSAQRSAGTFKGSR